MKAYEPEHKGQSEKMPVTKDHNVAMKFRSEGNSFHQRGCLFEALESYNKSLCVAKLNSVDIPLAFAHRSAVYLDAKEYKLCLENIQFARDSNYPSEKIATLKYLEEKCEKSIQGHVAKDDDDPWNFFKLSYPSNEKIPFIVNCLKVQNSKKFGRFVIATQGQLHFSIFPRPI